MEFWLKLIISLFTGWNLISRDTAINLNVNQQKLKTPPYGGGSPSSFRRIYCAGTRELRNERRCMVKFNTSLFSRSRDGHPPFPYQRSFRQAPNPPDICHCRSLEIERRGTVPDILDMSRVDYHASSSIDPVIFPSFQGPPPQRSCV